MYIQIYDLWIFCLCSAPISTVGEWPAIWPGNGEFWDALVNQHDHYRFKRTLQARNIQSAVKDIMSYLIHYHYITNLICITHHCWNWPSGPWSFPTEKRCAPWFARWTSWVLRQSWMEFSGEAALKDYWNQQWFPRNAGARWIWMYKNQPTVFQTSFVFPLGHHKDKPNWDHKPTGESKRVALSLPILLGKSCWTTPIPSGFVWNMEPPKSIKVMVYHHDVIKKSIWWNLGIPHVTWVQFRAPKMHPLDPDRWNRWKNIVSSC